MVRNWRFKHTVTLLVVIGLFAAFGIMLGPGPGWVREWVQENPKDPEGHVWLLRMADLYQYTLRKEERQNTYKEYLKLYNYDTKEKGYYYNPDEYIWVLFWEADAWESLDVRMGKRNYQARYIEIREVAESINSNHPAIELMDKKIKFFR